VLFAWRIAKLALRAHIEVGQLQPARFELLAQVLLGVLQHLAGQSRSAVSHACTSLPVA
jgi:hypothetical protein